MVYAGSSLYSQDVRELGYKPFEYWKGPKPVKWSYYKAESSAPTAGSSSETASVSEAAVSGPSSNSSDAGRGGPKRTNTTNTSSSRNSLSQSAPRKDLRLVAESTPLQPDQVHAAQRFVASLADDRNDMAFANNSTSNSRSSRGATFSNRPGGMPGIGYDPNKVSGGASSRGMSRGDQYIMQAGNHPTEFQLSDVHNNYSSNSRPADGFEPPPTYTESQFQRSGSDLNTGGWSAHATSTSNLAGLGAAGASSAAIAATAGTRAMDRGYISEKGPAWYDWRGWGKKAWGALAGAVIAIIVIIVVVAVVEVNKAKANRYPDYTALNYTLSETCKCIIMRNAGLSRTACTGGGSPLTLPRFGHDLV
jgi:hypothetical protein